jgi:hypothetical protein
VLPLVKRYGAAVQGNRVKKGVTKR